MNEWDLINYLRQNEGSSVTINADNADFNGLPDCLINVCGWWTDWEDLHFAGHTVLECLNKAKDHYDRMGLKTSGGSS